MLRAVSLIWHSSTTSSISAFRLKTVINFLPLPNRLRSVVMMLAGAVRGGQAAPLRVALAAPTGKAAARLRQSEAAGYEATEKLLRDRNIAEEVANRQRQASTEAYLQQLQDARGALRVQIDTARKGGQAHIVETLTPLYKDVTRLMEHSNNKWKIANRRQLRDHRREFGVQTTP